MAIIVRSEPTEPTPPPEPVKSEPLSEAVSTSLTPTDEARLLQACAQAGVTKAAYLRSAILAKLDTTGVK